jgi:DNA-binding LacI/PurR family transcriptional regulator
MNFSNEAFHESLRKIDPNKLLLLDLGDFEKETYSYVTQDFGKSVYNCLTAGIEQLQKYKKIILYFPEESEHPRITAKYFRKFCKENNFNFEVVQTIKKIDFTEGAAYFIIRQKDLVEIVKLCREKQLKVGKDIGLLAYNDTPMYEIIENGITVISTDFAFMGSKAAEFVRTRQKIKEIIPTKLIIRGSL